MSDVAWSIKVNGIEYVSENIKDILLELLETSEIGDYVSFEKIGYDNVD